MDIENSNHATTTNSHCVLALLDTNLYALGSSSGLDPGRKWRGGLSSLICALVTSTTSTRRLHVNQRVTSFQDRHKITFGSLSHFSTIASRLIMALTDTLEASTDNEAGNGERDEVGHVAWSLSF